MTAIPIRPYQVSEILDRIGFPEGSPESVLIRGRIDRVDVAKDGTVIAYDYKLRRAQASATCEIGRDLQIGIYLTALEQLFLRGHPIAGGGYYVLRGNNDRRNRGLYRAISH